MWYWKLPYHLVGNYRLWPYDVATIDLQKKSIQQNKTIQFKNKNEYKNSIIKPNERAREFLN